MKMKLNRSASRRQPRLNALLLAVLFAAVLLAPAALPGQPQPPPYHVVNYKLDVELLPDIHELRARARLQVAADEPLGSLTLHLNKNLSVERVLDPKGKALPFEHNPLAETFRVDLPRTLAPGESATLVVHYAGAFDPAVRPERGPVLAAIASGQSYLLRAARWFPQTADPWDRFPLTLSVTLPEEEIAIASGRAEPPQSPATGKTRYVFRADQPIPAGTLLAGRYEKVPAPGSAPLAFYLRTVPESYASANASTLEQIIAFFSDKFGPLDSPGLAIVETPDDTWEAYSAPGLLLLPAREWSPNINYRLLALSLARQWWASRVTPATTNDSWLADGLARYSEALYVEEAAGEEALRQVLEDLTIGALVDESAAPIANADRLGRFSPEFSAIVRDKGAMVFHMLRQVIGNDAFTRLLATYSQRFAGRVATIDDFERLAEEVSGQALGYFFGEWVRSTGVPQFKLEYVIYRIRKGFRVDGQIKHELEIFRMPVPVRIETEGPPVTETVEVAGLTSEFSIETFGKPLRIQIDPDYNVLKYTPALRVRVAIARGESFFQRGRYFDAVREYQRALEVKRNSSLAHYRMGEAFFEQRNYQAAANAFREAINGDREPLWTLVWSHIFLGKIFDLTGQRERAVNEYRRALETKDDTQGALAEAEKYLREPYRRPSRTIERVEEIQRR
ncbi:MAG: M1 family aminopeptidase [Terriglobia bacterium]